MIKPKSANGNGLMVEWRSSVLGVAGSYPNNSYSLLLWEELWQLPVKLLLAVHLVWSNLGQVIMWWKDNNLYEIQLVLTLGLIKTEVCSCLDRN